MHNSATAKNSPKALFLKVLVSNFERLRLGSGNSGAMLTSDSGAVQQVREEEEESSLEATQSENMANNETQRSGKSGKIIENAH